MTIIAKRYLPTTCADNLPAIAKNGIGMNRVVWKVHVFSLSYEISKNKRSNYFEKMRITIEDEEKTVVMKRKVDDDDSTNRKSLNFHFCWFCFFVEPIIPIECLFFNKLCTLWPLLLEQRELNNRWWFDCVIVGCTWKHCTGVNLEISFLKRSFNKRVLVDEQLFSTHIESIIGGVWKNIFQWKKINGQPPPLSFSPRFQPTKKLRTNNSNQLFQTKKSTKKREDISRKGVYWYTLSNAK